MFTEILRVKPVLDTGSAKAMEASLSARFARVASRFGSGLKHVIKGSILGISLGLLNKLLNPLEALEEKIKTLLGQGTDIQDLADRFHTSPGQLKRLEDVGQSLGVKPEDLKEMLTKFADAVENARKELQDPFQERSGTTRAVQNFVDEKDLAEGFLKFIQSLKAEGKGPGKDIFFGDNERRRAEERKRTGETLSDEERQTLIGRGVLKRQSGLESRQAIEKEVFGAVQFGAAKRLIESDFDLQAGKINEPSVGRLNQAINKVAGLQDQRNALQVQRETEDFLNASGRLNSQMIADIEKQEKLKQDRETKQLESFDDLKKASLAIQEVQNVFQDAIVIINKGVGYLADIATSFAKFKESRVFRYFGGGDK